MYADRFWFRFLGLSRELGYLPSDADQRRAEAALFKTVRYRWIPMYFLMCVACNAAAFIVDRYLPPLRVPRELRIGAWSFVSTIFGMLGAQWLCRRRYLNALRAYLLAEGIPVCQKCGYLLRGLVEPRCPECGESFDPHLLDRKDAGA